MRPMISIIMSVFNGSKSVEKCVISILNQTFKNFEFLILDDCSLDSTYEKIKNISESDNRVRTFRNKENIGLTRSLNILLKESKGEIIARIDADDVSLRERLEKQVNLMESNSLDLVTSGFCVVDSENNELYSFCPGGGDVSNLKWSLIFRNNIRHSTVMWRKRQDIEYDDKFRYAQDYELWCRMIRKKMSVGIIPETLVNIGFDSKTISANFGEEQERIACDVTKEQASYYLGREITHEEAKNLRLICEQKDARQFEEFFKMGAKETRKSVGLYLELANAFFEQEIPEKISMAMKISSDLNSILMKPYKNEILIEIFDWFRQSENNDFVALVNESFLKIKEEDWQKKETKLI